MLLCIVRVYGQYAHALKYRMHYGWVDGTCIVRYDNEIGNGDHRLIGKREEPYPFTDIETLLNDFFR
ncbi:MAG: toxin-antitoxin system TumE family protein [Sulfuricaulis sp.]